MPQQHPSNKYPEGENAVGKHQLNKENMTVSLENIFHTAGFIVMFLAIMAFLSAIQNQHKHQPLGAAYPC